MDDVDDKEEFFVYFIFGMNEYVQIKIEIMFKIGKLGEFIVELIRLGWIIMLFGSEFDFINMFLI